ncbi:hypothetical protein F2Q69_00031603 [Brassica cretica]|uniref:Uncharacterized protein n=1 Tax=Brassica cretica TaxID=69181 RepID=A0A8S9RTK4_BRACR|nr:hypothetical protein F2Q69_00031603 [Brassica cretica]
MWSDGLTLSCRPISLAVPGEMAMLATSEAGSRCNHCSSWCYLSWWSHGNYLTPTESLEVTESPALITLQKLSKMIAKTSSTLGSLWLVPCLLLRLCILPRLRLR